LWTLEDANGKCQLWDVLFFSYNLGSHLIAGRTFSMIAMLLGLALCTTTSQASQYHVFSWGIALILITIFLVSVSTTSIYNVWIVFWLLSYVMFVLIVRYMFVHPVPRRISKRGSQIVGSLYMFVGLCCLMTLVVLRSDYCTCSNLTSDELEGREIGDPCQQTCHIGGAAYCMIVGSALWFLAGWACFQFHIQPDKLKFNKKRSPSLYAHYPQQSIYSRAANIMPGSRHSNRSMTNSNRSKYSSKEIVGHSDSSLTSSIATSQVTSSGLTSTDRLSNTEPEEMGVDGSGTAAVKPSMDIIDEAAGPTTTMSDPESEGPQDEVDVDDDDDDESNEEADNRALQDLHMRLSEMDTVDNRGCCQKLCCDFRIKKRSRGEMVMFWTLRVLLALGFGLYIFFIYMLIGSRAENDRAARAPSTTPFFTTDVVCAFNPNDPFEEFRTFPNRELAHIANYTVAHCGECAYCSNPHDIRQYVETRKTIASKSKSCGIKVYFGDKNDLIKCLQDKIGFDRPCTVCWADNMINTADKCLSTCLRTLFSGFMTENNIDGAGDEGWLNACLYCDEKRSGPNFVTCSGVARRRLGIVSEIERNPEEQCPHVDVDWVNVDWSDIDFE